MEPDSVGLGVDLAVGRLALAPAGERVLNYCPKAVHLALESVSQGQDTDISAPPPGLLQRTHLSQEVIELSQPTVTSNTVGPPDQSTATSLDFAAFFEDEPLVGESRKES